MFVLYSKPHALMVCRPQASNALGYLRVVCQQVVPLKTGTADGRSVIQTSMRTMPIVLMEPARQFESALLGVVVSATVGPFAQSGLDESFGFAVGARSVRSGKTLANAELLAEAAEVAGAVAGTVIGEQAGDGDAEAGIVVDRSLQESGRRRGFLVGQGSGRRRCGSGRQWRHARTPSRRDGCGRGGCR